MKTFRIVYVDRYAPAITLTHVVEAESLDQAVMQSGMLRGDRMNPVRNVAAHTPAAWHTMRTWDRVEAVEL